MPKSDPNASSSVNKVEEETIKVESPKKSVLAFFKPATSPKPKYEEVSRKYGDMGDVEMQDVKVTTPATPPSPKASLKMDEDKGSELSGDEGGGDLVLSSKKETVL